MFYYSIPDSLFQLASWGAKGLNQFAGNDAFCRLTSLSLSLSLTHTHTHTHTHTEEEGGGGGRGERSVLGEHCSRKSGLLGLLSSRSRMKSFCGAPKPFWVCMSSIYRQADGVILLLRSLELCGTSTTNVRSLEPMVLVIFIQGKLLREMLLCSLGRCIQLKRVVWLKFGIRTMSDKATLFESAGIADAYLKYRPTYGPDVYDTIVSFCKESQSNSFSLAVDVGCGSGQSTLPLTKRFSKVVGLDVSESQIAKAPTQFENLSFRVGPAEDLSFLDSGSADLVTVAQAMHWMDLDRFYPEVDRVLKPGGALVVYGYGQPRLDEPAAEETMNYVRMTLYDAPQQT